ncbi:MAG: glycine cleavage system protein GcvH [Desulfobacteraceae bacterium]|nr:glycine cleavage system protein GcvH [Desulfobacteraceae bacterium]
MKELEELNLPEDLSYSIDHVWVQNQGEKARLGITDFAQDQLGEIVFVELPETDDAFNQGEAFCTVESLKTVVEVYIPIGGTIVTVNNELEDSPELVNNDPYEQGWLVEITPTDRAALGSLMKKDEYLEMLKGSD